MLTLYVLSNYCMLETNQHFFSFLVDSDAMVTKTQKNVVCIKVLESVRSLQELCWKRMFVSFLSTKDMVLLFYFCAGVRVMKKNRLARGLKGKVGRTEEYCSFWNTNMPKTKAYKLNAEDNREAEDMDFQSRTLYQVIGGGKVGK